MVMVVLKYYPSSLYSVERISDETLIIAGSK